MYGHTSILVAAEMVIFVCGGVLSSLSYRAYRRSRSRALGALFSGLLLVTIGALLGGAFLSMGVLDVAEAASASAALVALGFLVVTYSMYVDSHAGLSS